MITLTEIYGEPATGKSHAAHAGWPDPLHIDTAFVQLGFRSFDIEDGSRGETWPVVVKYHDWDVETAEDHYRYVRSWDDVMEAVQNCDRDSIILDNAVDLRGLAAKHWCEDHDEEWPKKQQWGQINDMIDTLLQEATDRAHTVVISQMTDEYLNGESTGERERDGPKRVPFKCEFRLFMEIDDDERIAHVEKNRLLDKTSEDWVDEFSGGAGLKDLLMVSGVPKEFWEIDDA